jgi:flagellar hook assembly protein FlgD
MEASGRIKQYLASLVTSIIKYHKFIWMNNKTYVFWHGFNSGSGELYWSTEGKDLSDTEAPTPNPMVFEIKPHKIGATVSMRASTATDASGGVKYYFECTTDNSHNSGWQNSTTYVDSNLTIGKKYCYRVTAQDANGNESIASDEECVYIKELDIYVEKDGSCIMEAENAFVNNNGDHDSNAGLIQWYEESTENDYVGSGYMTTENEVTWNGKWNKATELLWKVNISNAGEYYLAARKKAISGTENSAFMGVNGMQKGGSEFNSIDAEFTWNHGSVSLGYLGVGMHRVQVRRREDGFMIDRVMISNNKDNLPSEGSTEVGGVESERTDSVLTAIGEEESIVIPKTFVLNAAYPNPFNPATTISYGLSEASHVKISIYDIQGSLVTTLQDGKQNAGYHKVIWNTKNSNGSKVSTGIYLYKIIAGKYSGTGKLVYLK